MDTENSFKLSITKSTGKQRVESILQERTNRLNLLYSAIENESFPEKHSATLSDESAFNMTTLIRDLEQQIELNLNTKHEAENQIDQFKQDISIMLHANKSQSDLIDELKCKLNEAELLIKNQAELIESWQQEKDDLVQQKNNLQEELYSYMKRLSELKIFTEDAEMSFKQKLLLCEEQLSSCQRLNDVKNAQLSELLDKFNELNEDLKREAHSNACHEQNVLLIENSFESEIANLKRQIELLKSELAEQKKAHDCNESKREDFSQRLLLNKNEEIDELIAQIDKLKANEKSHMETIGALEGQLVALKQSQLEFETNCSNKHLDYFKQLEKQIEYLNCQMARNQENFDAQLSQVNCDMQNQINRLEGEKSCLMKECDEQKTLVDSLRQDFQHKIQSNQSKSMESLQVKEEIISMLRADIELLKQDAHNANEQLIKEIQSMHVHYEKEMELLAGQNKELKANIEDQTILKQLVQQLEDQFKLELAQVNEFNRNAVCQLKIEHAEEIQGLRAQLVKQTRLNEAEESSLGLRLKEQVNLTRELDSQLMLKLSEQSQCLPAFDTFKEEIFALKEFIMSKPAANDYQPEQLLNQVVQVFQKENTSLLMDLHKLIASSSKQIDAEELASFDRTGLQLEIEQLKAERNKLRQKLRLVEYAKDAVEINANDLRQMLATERTKCFGFIERLNTQQAELRVQAEQLHELRQELGQIRETIGVETRHFMSLCRQLESDYLSKLMSAQQQESKFLELESRTNGLQEILLKKQINYLSADLRNEKTKTENCAANSRSLQQMSLLNQQLTADNMKLDNKIRQLDGEVAELTKQTQGLKHLVKSLDSENMQLKVLSGNKSLSDAHREKFKRLYLKYLKAESFRKSLVYQKKFLIIILAGYERSGGDSRQSQIGLVYLNKHLCSHKPKRRFKSIVMCLIAVIRIQFLAKKKNNI